MAAAGDRHLAEFMPGGLYLNSPEATEEWAFYLTSVDWRTEDLRRKLQKSAEFVSGEREIVFEKSGEEGILLIKALCGLTRVVSNVNLPNVCLQIDNLPPETVVESNALFSYNDIRPVVAGGLNKGILELIKPHAENQTEVLYAAVNCDREAVYRAFARDPLIGGRCTMDDIRKLVDDMITNTAKYLPKGWML
jgi:alpha-galactosidase